MGSCAMLAVDLARATISALIKGLESTILIRSSFDQLERGVVK